MQSHRLAASFIHHSIEVDLSIIAFQRLIVEMVYMKDLALPALLVVLILMPHWSAPYQTLRCASVKETSCMMGINVWIQVIVAVLMAQG